MRRNIFNKDPLRVKKSFLLHRQEINRLFSKIKEKRPTTGAAVRSIFQWQAKVEIGLARVEKLYDKREDIAKKRSRREQNASLKVEKLILKSKRGVHSKCIPFCDIFIFSLLAVIIQGAGSDLKVLFAAKLLSQIPESSPRPASPRSCNNIWQAGSSLEIQCIDHNIDVWV